MEIGRQLQILPSFNSFFFLTMTKAMYYLSNPMVENVANDAKVEV